MTHMQEPASLSAAEDVGARPAPNRAALIGIAAVLATVTNAVAFMLPPLLPLITISYAHNSVTAATWVFTALTLGGGAGFVLIPRMTDVLSDRTVSLLSGGFLTGGALIAAVADNYVALVAGSALMGFGGAAQLVPLSFLRRHLGGNAVSTAVTVLIMATGTGVVLGMVGGGVSLKLWPVPDRLTLDPTTMAPVVPHQSIAPFFYVLAGLFVLTTIGLLAIVPNSPPESRGRIGVFGTVWLIGWVAVVLLGFSAPADTAIGKHADLVLLLGLVLAAGWVLAERKSSKPTFDLTLLRKPFVTTACLSAGLFGCVDAAFLVLVNYYLQNPNDPAMLHGNLPNPFPVGGVRLPAGAGWPDHVAQYGLNFSPLATSLVMLPFALTMFLSGKVSERFVARGRPGVVLVAGAVICAVGLVFLAVAHDQVWEYVVGSGIVGLGSRAGYSGAFAVPQFVVPEERAGMAAGMPGTVMAIGFAVGAAVITVVQNASGFVYQSVDAAVLTELGTKAASGSPAAVKAYTDYAGQVNLSTSDLLLDGTHFPLADVYTYGYWITLAFPVLVIVATLVSRLRHPHGFSLLVGASD
ncbi:MFS transporter [Amycolatopsis circi]|uniref:MFS transporter n=1 Tax=Amycolatopsis circi TaxID=871959 RepID=UPI000E25D544|nr:MFS transporter [Amycolatopsis circi]